MVTSAELPKLSGLAVDVAEGAYMNMRFLSNNCLADDKVLYKGHAVAGVAATSPHIAEEALSLIDVEYEVLPWVIKVLDAMKADAPVLHENLATLSNPDMMAGMAGALRSEDDHGKGNKYSQSLGVRGG